VIPAAGLGSRFLPVTKSLPKELLPLVDKPAIQWVVEEAVRAGLTDVLIVSARTKRGVEDHFDRNPELEQALELSGRDEQAEEIRALADLARITVVRQHEPLGLGHAVSLARRHVGDEAFAVLLPDDVMAERSTLLSDMIAAHEDRHPVVALKRFPPERISAYGVAVVDTEPDARGWVAVRGFVEKPPAHSAPSDLAIMGRYVLTPDVFTLLDRVVPGAGGEIQLTDALHLLAAGRTVRGVVFDEGRYDLGDRLDWLRANVEVALDHPTLGAHFRDVLLDVMDRAELRTPSDARGR